MPCLHSRQRSVCKDCGGVGICKHGSRHSHCKDCGGSQVCEHKRLRSACKECKGGLICEHNRVRSKCKDCGGRSVCKHNRLRSACKDCGGRSICEHKRQRSHCKECGGGSICEHNRLRGQCKECCGSQICDHNRVRSKCKECNPNHIYYGIEGHHGRGSDFEHLMITKLCSVLPASAKLTEQYPVPNLNGGRYPFRLDVVVTINDTFEFIVELDGADHYPDGWGRTLRDSVLQTKRDRYVEQWALQNNLSMFRVPYTCRTKKRSTTAINYILNAAANDHLQKQAHIHYLDYNNTYIRIDEFAFNTEGIEFITASPSSLRPSVYIRSK
eukprot:3365241-Rhodomonas_salina.1